MIDLFIQPFVDFDFMRRAWFGCIIISLGASPLGVFLMLRRMSLAGDAMAHAILPGAAVGYLLGGLSLTAMTFGGAVAGLVVALLSGLIARTTVLKEDASLATFYIISLALGVLIISIRGDNVDLIHILFGTVLALNNDALLLICATSSLTILTLSFLFRLILMESVDSQFLSSVSRWGAWAHYAFLALVVLNLVSGFHAIGSLMIIGVMLLPATSARFWGRSVGQLILVALLIAAVSSTLGLLASYHFSLPSGPSIILTTGIFHVLSLIFGWEGGWLSHYYRAPKVTQ
ncbi:MAG: metal ABC transporter permease [Alphaproteobacteria bacterium TMED89]|nr:zinc ABC transporter permease [Rhodospirillaceae bacterium]RPH13174.1 MAG: metal ABC transporter permease [Alphaproteobacteria bacterium TMED89]